MTRKLIGPLVLIAALALPASALAWDGSTWTPNTCGADLTTEAVGSGAWWIQVSDESGVLYETTLSAVKAHHVTIGGWSHDIGYHVVTYKVANAANHSDGLRVYVQEQLNCAALAGPAGPSGPPGPPGKTPEPQTCTSNRVYHVKIAARFRGQTIHSARLTWANGFRHTTAKLGKDGRLRANVSFRGITSPVRGLWTIKLQIVFDGGKHATLTRLVRLCSPDDSNLNFATDVHRDGS